MSHSLLYDMSARPDSVSNFPGRVARVQESLTAPYQPIGADGEEARHSERREVPFGPGALRR